MESACLPRHDDVASCKQHEKDIIIMKTLGTVKKLTKDTQSPYLITDPVDQPADDLSECSAFPPVGQTPVSCDR